MDRIRLLLLALLLAGGVAWGQVADSVDVLDYDISLDLSAGKPFGGDATLTVRLAAPCSVLGLHLYGTADSIWVGGLRVDDAGIDSIPLDGLAVGDTATVRICYTGKGYVENYGWGGFHFDNGMSYNLGVGFGTNPHNMGGAVMPCRDNFHDKATYTLRVLTRQGWSAECGGLLQSRDTLDDGRERSVWRIGQPVPTYLVSVSQAPWKRIERTVESLYGTYPLTLGITNQDSARTAKTFLELDSVVPMFERCLGPYRWGRIGYISTAQGSMEHVNNIALDSRFMATVTERGQMTIAHELGHAWFGNLITCATEADMWINEGGASFCSELAMEANQGREASDRYYQTNLENVLRQTHLSDGAYLPLSPMPHSKTYGSTTYDKGALVWHSLRGLLGDSVFYVSMQRLMEHKAFGNVDAYGVRDSLSLYSGVDLTDFFGFHVFSPGFVDYCVHFEPASAPGAPCRIGIRQQTLGIDTVVHANWVPVTFYTREGKSHKIVFTFDGQQLDTLVALPIDAAYCVLDADLELSDAATLGVFDLGGSGTRTVKHAHVRMGLSDSQPQGTTLAVEHHWGRPWEADTLAAVKRTAGRYWVVRGTDEQYHGVRGQFRYVCETYGDGDYTHLDRGFYNQPGTIDSMVVLFRPNSHSPWQAVSHQRSGNEKEGFFIVDNIRTGEYTLAVADMEHLGIDLPAVGGSALFPNPLRSGEALTLSVPTGEPFTVSISDSAGRRVWKKRGCRSGQQVTPNLPAGTYLVLIENKVVSLQSKLIVL